jgi:hypothetical protein
MTYLAPWLLGGGIIGGLVIGGGVGVLIGAGVTFAAYVVIDLVGGIYLDRAQARRAQRRFADWLPAGADGLQVEASTDFLDGYSSHGRYTLLGVDFSQRRLGFVSADKLAVVEPTQVRCWRRAKPAADHEFEIELLPPPPGADRPNSAKRIEVTLRSPEDETRLRDALRRALGDPVSP